MLKRNLAINLVGRGLSLLLQAVLLPLYLHILGVEAVGLIGLYTTMVTALGVLEYAVGTMVMREMASLSEADSGGQIQRDLLRTTEALYALILTCIGTAILLAAPMVAQTWLSNSGFTHLALKRCIELMGWTVALQLFGSLYLNVLNGRELQLQSNILTIGLVAMRGTAAILTLLVISTTVEAYFVSQLICTGLFMALSAGVAWRSLSPGKARLSPILLWSTWRKTPSLTSAAVLFVILSQTDKLIASSMLSLRDFGYYAIASTIASLMFSVYGSFGTALVPRFTRLLTLDLMGEVARLFHVTTQLCAFILLPFATVVIFHAEPLIRFWTADPETARQAAPIAAYLTIGVLFACLACASNSLQLAAGFTDLNLLNNLAWASGVPITLVCTRHFGAVGATTMWLIGGLINLILAPSIFHRRMLKTERVRWYVNDLGTPCAAAAIVGLASTFLNDSSLDLIVALQLAGVWMTAAVSILLVCPALRKVVWEEILRIVRRITQTAAPRPKPTIPS